MLELDRRALRDAEAATTLTLPWERRGVTRQRVRLDDGREAGVFLARGEILRGGDKLASAAGDVVAIVAAPQPVMVVRASDTLALAIEVTNVIDGVPPVITSPASVSIAENTTGTVYTALADDPDSASLSAHQ